MVDLNPLESRKGRRDSDIEESIEIRKIDTNIMLDPSLFLAESTMKKVFNSIKENLNTDFRFFISASFINSLDHDLKFDQITRFFLGRAGLSKLNVLKSSLRDFENIIKPYNNSSMKSEYIDIWKRNMDKQRFNYLMNNQNILNILSDEWRFVNEMSWLGARIKKTFTYFKHGGASCIEFSKKHTEEIVRKTIKKDSEILKPFDFIRGFSKWAAVGSTPFASIIHPMAGAFVGTIAGFFLLLDP